MNLNNIFNKNQSSNDIYNMWYAFAEPQLRIFHLIKLLNKKIKIDKKLINKKNNFLYKKILDRNKYISKIFNI